MKINVESPIMTALTKAFDAVAAAFYFFLCCIPIVTIGASLTALMKTMMAISADQCSGVTSMFFGTFRGEFKQSTLAWLIMLLIGLILAGDIWVCWFAEVEIAAQMLGIFQWITILFIVLYACVLVYLFAGIAKFVVTLKQAFLNAFLFAAKYMLQTLLLVLLLAFMILAVYTANILAFPVLVLCLYLMAGTLRRVFDLYLGVKKPEKADPLGESL